MNNVVDEVLNTAATDNEIKYILTHEDGTTELVRIDLATPVTTAGTPLNKALFDSIQSDLNKMLIKDTDKASYVEVVLGTNTDHYIVPATLQYKLTTLNYSPDNIVGTNTTATGTLYNGTQLPKSNTIIITGKATITSSAVGSGYNASITFNGTGIGGATSQTIDIFQNAALSNGDTNAFVIIINKATKTISGIYKGNDTMSSFSYGYTTLTSITGSAKGRNSSNTCTLATNLEGLN